MPHSHDSRRSRPLERPWPVLAGVLLVTAAYYVVPLEDDRSLVWRVITFGAALALLTLLAVRELRRGSGDPVGRLVLLLVLVVMAFAATFYLLAQVPGEFSGLGTRTDALYFTVVMMTTIGFGDIHPTGQLARGLVVVAVVFHLLVVTSLVSTLLVRLRQQADLPTD